MHPKFLVLLSVTLLLGSLAFTANAQFTTSGSEKTSVRWSQIESPTYKIIYPRGLDSLARVYAKALETSAGVVGNSARFRPNESYRRKMPVILHSYNVFSNGQVTWTPRRLELETLPDPFDPDPYPWVEQLALHESRHVSQMQFSSARPFRWWKIPTGELAAGLWPAIYGGSTFMEGDAVVAETALSHSGRGRTADFLEYYRVSFVSGQMRSYKRWRYGSSRYYTPDHYRLGYVSVAGLRAVFSEPDFTKRFYQRIIDHHGVSLGNMSKTTREIAGIRFNKAFDIICDTLRTQWARDEAKRGPYLQDTQITPTPSRFTEFTGLASVGNSLYALRNSLTRPYELVKIDPQSHKVKKLSTFSSRSDSPEYDPSRDRLYWSEQIHDLRWEQHSYSDIFYLAISSSTTHRLTRHQHYYHPASFEDNLSVSEYSSDGSTAVVLLDPQSGKALSRFKAPDGLQVVETVWTSDGELYCSAISAAGEGIYRVRDWSPVLEPKAYKIKQLWNRGEHILLTSDRTGVNELYSLDAHNGDLRRLTNTRFGASDFRFLGDTLYYSALRTDGRMVYRQDKLLDIDASEEAASFPFADALSSGEIRQPDFSDSTSLSQPRRYSNLGHLLHFHSWIPFYVNFDAVKNLSAEDLVSTVGLGATLFFQNDLGNAYGSVSYDARPHGGTWFHAGHLNFVYKGFYPVIELGLHINERKAVDYRYTHRYDGSEALALTQGTRPRVRANVDLYIPLSSSRGGITRGLIPRLRFSGINESVYDLTGHRMGTTSTLSASVRGYILQSTPPSRLYPRFGIGAELGYSLRPFVTSFMCSNAYAQVYGYLPGFYQTNGIRLSALYERRLGSGKYCEAYAVCTPRGFNSDTNDILALYPDRLKLSIDYSLPFGNIDWAGLSPVAYIRGFELTPHADLTLLGSRDGSLDHLYSLGADLSLRLGNLLWITYDTRIGVSYNYNGGSLMDSLLGSGYESKHHSVSLVFNIDF